MKYLDLIKNFLYLTSISFLFSFFEGFLRGQTYEVGLEVLRNLDGTVVSG